MIAFGGLMTRRVVSAISAVIFCATVLGAQSKPKPAHRPLATLWEAKGEPTTTRSGVQYWDLAAGNGFEAVQGKRVKVH
jgi:FKBP-type peptidyl-prolyl cis-trans isomerase